MIGTKIIDSIHHHHFLIWTTMMVPEIDDYFILLPLVLILYDLFPVLV